MLSLMGVVQMIAVLFLLDSFKINYLIGKSFTISEMRDEF